MALSAARQTRTFESLTHLLQRFIRPVPERARAKITPCRVNPSRCCPAKCSPVSHSGTSWGASLFTRQGLFQVYARPRSSAMNRGRGGRRLDIPLALAARGAYSQIVPIGDPGHEDTPQMQANLAGTRNSSEWRRVCTSRSMARPPSTHHLIIRTPLAGY